MSTGTEPRDVPAPACEVVDASEARRRARQLELVGVLAERVTHDFNNLLTVILSCAETVAAELAPSHPSHDDVRDITRSAVRATELTRELQRLARGRPGGPSAVAPAELLSSLEQLLRRVVRPEVRLVVDGRRAVERLHADPWQLEQLVMHLAVGASSAMADGATLVIGAADVALGEEEARGVSGGAPGSQLRLTATDSGDGANVAPAARVFEVDPWGGVDPCAGPGLPAVLAIAHECGYGIAVRAEAGRGRSLDVYVPRRAPTT